MHTSTRQLEAGIRAFIEQHNENPKPFKWTKSAEDILAAVKRFCLRVEQNLCHELWIQVTRAWAHSRPAGPDPTTRIVSSEPAGGRF